MEKFSNVLMKLRDFFLRIAETGGALVLATLTVYLLLGNSAGSFAISVAETVANFTAKVTPAAVLGLAVILAMSYLLRKQGK
ncbi:MAG: hypothetical protein P8N62_07125 [Alphaproteobacteria bacterium]|nr:hypothetical protein [Alphaproteobacteria bacterium]